MQREKDPSRTSTADSGASEPRTFDVRLIVRVVAEGRRDAEVALIETLVANDWVLIADVVGR